MNPSETDQLIEKAIAARAKAYAPYSDFKVGAALLCSDHQVITGCNVENASLGLSICAERVAISQAISNGVNQFLGIVVVASPLAAPCGACRQFMSEFAEDDFVIIAVDASDKEIQKHWRMLEILPDSFRLRK